MFHGIITEVSAKETLEDQIYGQEYYLISDFMNKVK